MTSSRWPVRTAGGVGVVWGVVLLRCGHRVWRSVAREPATSGDLLAVDALGLRHLVQGTAQAVAPSRMQGAFVAVDLIHALTMLPLVVLDQRRRRAATLSCVVALASATTTLATGRRQAVGRP